MGFDAYNMPLVYTNTIERQYMFKDQTLVDGKRENACHPDKVLKD